MSITSVADLLQDEHNLNLGTERGEQAIEQSFKLHGAGRSILVDKNGRIIAGNKSQKAALKAGITKARVVETAGDELVVVKRTDLDLQKDKSRKALAILDNRAGQLNLRFDFDALQATIEDAGISPEEVAFTEEELTLPAPSSGDGGDGAKIGEAFQVVIEVNSEESQRELYERMTGEGYKCRLLTL